MSRTVTIAGLSASHVAALVAGLTLAGQLDDGTPIRLREPRAEDVYGAPSVAHVETVHLRRTFTEVDAGVIDEGFTRYEIVFEVEPAHDVNRFPRKIEHIEGETTPALRATYDAFVGAAVADYCAGLDGGCPEGTRSDYARAIPRCVKEGPEEGGVSFWFGCIRAEVVLPGASSTVSHQYVPPPADQMRMSALLKSAALPRWCESGKGLCPTDGGP